MGKYLTSNQNEITSESDRPGRRRLRGVAYIPMYLVPYLVYSTIYIAPYTRVQTQRSTSGAAANIAARTPPILAAPHELVEDLVRIIITITDGRYGINYSCIIITGRL